MARMCTEGCIDRGSDSCPCMYPRFEIDEEYFEPARSSYDDTLIGGVREQNLKDWML